MIAQLKKETFLSANGISYRGTIEKAKKNEHRLQPLFEAFTNSLESIIIARRKNLISDNGTIKIKLFLIKTLTKGVYDFHELVVEDTGIGFDDENFERIINFNDVGKGFKNKGSGRVQYIKFFNKAEYKSIYVDKSAQSGFKERTFSLSASDAYLMKNAIIYYKDTIEVEAESANTVLSLNKILKSQDENYYKQLDSAIIKEALIEHYLMYFCANRNNLPSVIIENYLDGASLKNESIESKDIPEIDKQTHVDVQYCKLSNDRKTIVKTPEKEEFEIKAFKIPKDQLNENGLKLTSKGELAKDLKLDILKSDDYIGDYRYLFLVSGDYIDNNVEDARGDLHIVNREQFKKKYKDTTELFDKPEILLDDIQDKANHTVIKLYDEIKKLADEKDKKIEKLKKCFCLMMMQSKVRN